MSTQIIISIIVISLVVIAAAIFLFFEIKKKGLRKVAIEFIVLAEAKFAYGKNFEKFNYVFDAVYELLPKVLKIFVTKAMIVKFIEKVFAEIKVALDYKNEG